MGVLEDVTNGCVGRHSGFPVGKSTDAGQLRLDPLSRFVRLPHREQALCVGYLGPP